jgi:cytochrome c-type biogenesis protein
VNAPIALAFASGMLATVNPCGFPLLPAYLSYFLGIEKGEGSTRASVSRSLVVGASVAAGFLFVFLSAGIALSHLNASIYEWAPWLTIVIGVVLFVLGVAMLRGFELVVALPKLSKGGRERTTRSMFVFGISYAVASVSCTLPTFMVAVAGTFRRENLLSSVVAFVSYAAGMTIVLLVLTVSMGLARQSLVHSVRRAMPYITRIAGGLLVIAGAYVAYYGWYEVRVGQGEADRSSIVGRVTDWSDSITNWVYEVGPARLGWILGAALAAVLAVTYGLRVRRRT